MRKQPWELPPGVDRAELARFLTRHLLQDVDELARRYRLLENANQACTIAAQSGVLSQELVDARRNAEVELLAGVALVVSMRGMVLEAEAPAAAEKAKP